MKEFKLPNNTYFTVKSFMIRDLHLKGNELLVYAIIDGFSHDGQSKFVGGISYLCAMTSSTKTNIISCLKNLREKGLIDRIEIKIGNIEKHSYFVTNLTKISGKQSEPEEDVSGLQSEHGSGLQSEHGAGKESKPIIEEKEFLGRNVQSHPLSPSDFLPIDFKIDGTKKSSLEISGDSDHFKSNRGGEIKNLQPSTPQPPVSKTAEQMLTTLRQKTPKAVMEEILAGSDLDLPTLSAMFTDYWVYEKGRPFVSKDWKGLVSSFEQWAKVAKSKEIPEKEVKQGLHTNPILEKIIPNIERLKMIKLNPTDANKVNGFIREFNPSEWALRDGTKSFLDGGSKEWDHWIKTVKGAIQREKMGDI